MTLRSDTVSGTVFALLGVVVWVYSSAFPSLPGGHPGPALFPRLIALGFVGAGGWILVRSRFYQASSPVVEESRPSRIPQLLRLFAAIVLVGAYPLLEPILGFAATAAVAAFGIGVLLGANLLRLILTAVLASLTIYWLFTTALGVPL